MFLAVIIVVAVIIIPHVVLLLAGSVGLQWAETILIKKYKINVCTSTLLQSEERKYIVWLQPMI